MVRTKKLPPIGIEPSRPWPIAGLPRPFPNAPCPPPSAAARLQAENAQLLAGTGPARVGVTAAEATTALIHAFVSSPNVALGAEAGEALGVARKPWCRQCGSIVVTCARQFDPYPKRCTMCRRDRWRTRRGHWPTTFGWWYLRRLYTGYRAIGLERYLTFRNRIGADDPVVEELPDSSYLIDGEPPKRILRRLEAIPGMVLDEYQPGEKVIPQPPPGEAAE